MNNPSNDAFAQLLTRFATDEQFRGELGRGGDDLRAGLSEKEGQQLDQITQSALQLKSQTDGDRQRLQHIEQQRDDEGRRADTLQQRVAALDIDITKVTAQHTTECGVHDATRSALQQAEGALDASREECHTQATAVAQRDEQLAAAEAARQQEKHHFTALIAEKDRRVAEQAASIRDVTAALKRAQSALRKSS